MKTTIRSKRSEPLTSKTSVPLTENQRLGLVEIRNNLNLDVNEMQRGFIDWVVNEARSGRLRPNMSIQFQLVEDQGIAS